MLTGSFAAGTGADKSSVMGIGLTLPVYREHLNYRVMSVQRNRVNLYRSSSEVGSRKVDNGDAGSGNGRKRTTSWNGADRGCVAYKDHITSPETELTSRWCSNARPFVESMNEAMANDGGACHWCSFTHRRGFLHVAVRIGRSSVSRRSCCVLHTTASSFLMGALQSARAG